MKLQFNAYNCFIHLLPTQVFKQKFVQKPNMLIGQRRILGLLIFCGLITNYMLRVNISIAIITMVRKDNNSTGSESLCVEANTTDERDEDDGTKLDWSGAEVSNVLLSFFIGYAAFQVY